MKSPTSKTETNRSKKGQSRLARTAAASAAGGMLAVGLVGVSTVNAPARRHSNGPAQATSSRRACRSIRWLPAVRRTSTTTLTACSRPTRRLPRFTNDEGTDDEVGRVHRDLQTAIRSTSAALENIISNQADDYVRQEMEKVEVDLENSHVGLKLYHNFVACVDAATAPGCHVTHVPEAQHLRNQRGDSTCQCQVDHQRRQLVHGQANGVQRRRWWIQPGPGTLRQTSGRNDYEPLQVVESAQRRPQTRGKHRASETGPTAGTPCGTCQRHTSTTSGT